MYTFIVPILYYTNTWFTAYLPLTGSDAYNNMGNVYNSSRILNENGVINDVKYQA